MHTTITSRAIRETAHCKGPSHAPLSAMKREGRWCWRCAAWGCPRQLAKLACGLTGISRKACTQLNAGENLTPWLFQAGTDSVTKCKSLLFCKVYSTSMSQHLISKTLLLQHLQNYSFYPDLHKNLSVQNTLAVPQKEYHSFSHITCTSLPPHN